MLKKYDANKKKMEEKLTKLGRERKEGLARVRTMEANLEVAWNELRAAQDGLKVAQVAVVTESEQVKVLRDSLEESKLESVECFSKGFDITLAIIQMLYLGIVISRVDLDKVVIDGQIVHPPFEEDQGYQGSPFGLRVEH